MIFNWIRLARVTAITACCSLAVWISSTSAKDKDTSVLVKKPADASVEGPVLPPPANPKEAAPVVPPQSKADPFAPGNSAPKAIPPQQKQQRSTTEKRPFMRPAEPRDPGRGILTGADEPMPPPALQPPTPQSADIHVSPTPPIVYHADHDARRMYRSGQTNLIMVTQDPADGCCYEIPMCIPACCTGDPQVSSGHGIFGRGVVEYCWPCGFRAEVKFRHVLGDIKVEYEGD